MTTRKKQQKLTAEDVLKDIEKSSYRRNMHKDLPKASKILIIDHILPMVKERPIVEKSDDILTNIHNRYYNEKKYGYISYQDAELKEAKQKIKQASFKASNDMEEAKEKEKAFLSFAETVMSHFNSIPQNEDTYFTDSMDKYFPGASEELQKDISELMSTGNIDDDESKTMFIEGLASFLEKNFKKK